MATDEDLVVRLARGDETVLQELLQRYERPLSNFIYRHTSGRDVEDLYQETWWRVVRQSARFDPTRRFSTWLLKTSATPWPKACLSCTIAAVLAFKTSAT